jgi:NDP-sugar pyrophosphorylase family protein
MRMPPIAVLAGGLGTRLGAMTTATPKALIEIAGKPFVAHQLELFARRGLREAVFCIGHFGGQIEDFVGDGSRFGLTVRYSNDGETLRGTGGAILNALPWLGDEFLVTYGDSYLDISYEQVVRAFRSSHLPALMTVFCNNDRWDASNVEFKDGCIATYDKTRRSERMQHIDYGLLAMTPAAFSGWRRTSNFDLSAVLTRMAVAGELGGFETTTRFYEIGSQSGIVDLSEQLAKPSELHQ